MDLLLNLTIILFIKNLRKSKRNKQKSSTSIKPNIILFMEPQLARANARARDFITLNIYVFRLKIRSIKVVIFRKKVSL